ncbi:hypothetical protein [Auraticoccus monumenti]|uniref:Uncharacterized protein n=1 Tax=Auraticoccus monumenti TaxID=675864 RepID=A0A1G6SMN5_9ACTN|nr:hypothetical protein [Auraticoccus monumenti]SDD17891.1 hypothetical protein SAMN04489747_0367 [Auraticoccus monumenti]
MAYTAHRPHPNPSADELRARIPGWGVDLDPADRPSTPKLRFDPAASGAHWDLPDRQPEEHPREHSIEHAGVTPVFGTAQPLHGVSGAIRRYSYRRFSEARAAHWLLLIAADRVDFVGSRFTGLLQGRPDDPVSETGILAEARYHGLRSRTGDNRRRVDTAHTWIDPLVVGAPWIGGAALALVGSAVVRRAAKGLRRR